MSTVIDAHHHLWDPASRDYPWMTGPAAPLRRRYGLDDLREQVEPAGVGRTVVVQAVSDVGETTELLATAAASAGLIGGVVGWVDLTASDLAEQVARLRELPGGDHLVGVRHQVHDEVDPDWLARPEVVRGLKVLAQEGLAYDLLVRTRELPAARRAAEQVEQLSFVLDHGAKPPIADRSLEPWATELAALADLPNVACKVSGLVTEAGQESWTIDDLRPYTDHILDRFGPDRLLFGSDWPVCTLAATYADVLAAARDCLGGLSPTESDAVFGGNAALVYGL